MFTADITKLPGSLKEKYAKLKSDLEEMLAKKSDEKSDKTKPSILSLTQAIAEICGITYTEQLGPTIEKFKKQQKKNNMSDAELQMTCWFCGRVYPHVYHLCEHIRRVHSDLINQMVI